MTTSSVVHEHERGTAADLVSARGGYRGMEENVRRELREDSPCGLADVPDSDITVTYTVRREDSFGAQ
ncbi:MULTISPECIES: hypothetical protein [unclassified Streptomyces]|uniref:hypothetical protein n=1 Tax=unclassified Streptomyces TaxID=2593676 RepID=UPI001FD40EF0|nr:MULTISPECIES: hypothetical protein [unclassified Streptomyces]MDH3033990.1 hypothetical protein [Streptomyces sp. TRM75561]